MSITLACKLFFKVIGNRAFARDVSEWLARPVTPALTEPPPPAGPVRTEAIELLATLQREGRLVDFLQEKLDGYNDAQIGAAVRDIHRDCAKTLDRLFGLAPLTSEKEGAEVTLPASIDPGAWKLTGHVGENPTKGRLCHHGWKITRHELPAWTGRKESAWIVAPAEVELAAGVSS